MASGPAQAVSDSYDYCDKSGTWTYIYKDGTTDVGDYEYSRRFGYTLKTGIWTWTTPSGIKLKKDCGSGKYNCKTGPDAFN